MLTTQHRGDGMVHTQMYMHMQYAICNMQYLPYDHMIRTWLKIRLCRRFTALYQPTCTSTSHAHPCTVPFNIQHPTSNIASIKLRRDCKHGHAYGFDVVLPYACSVRLYICMYMSCPCRCPYHIFGIFIDDITQ